MPSWFQSRNRDAFHFRVKQIFHEAKDLLEVFQSRNRDAFHFRYCWMCASSPVICFNLAIEMLFISGNLSRTAPASAEKFQSRNRDAFHIRTRFDTEAERSSMVSISQSRCFSYQVGSVRGDAVLILQFQSRNRDAFHIRPASLR